MKTRSRLGTGIAAAAALVFTAAGAAAGCADATPGGHATSASARAATTDNTFTDGMDRMELAQAKRIAVWNAAQRARMRPQRMDTSRFTDQADLARVKRDVARVAAERARGR